MEHPTTYRLEIDPDPASVRIADERTGQDVTAQFGAASITLELRPGELPVMRVETFVRAKITGIARPEWYAKDPRTGRSARLAALTFADGYVANLSGAGDEPLRFSQTERAEPD